jgi:DNA-binding GntR family transcriptional regulator
MTAGDTKIRRIADSILADIAAGRLRSGDRIESERKLTQSFGVSLGTVQKALDELAHRGVLVREHGRGTFVRGVGSSLDARYVRFQDKAGRELPLYWHILGHRKARTTRALAAFFGEDVPLIRIDRSIDVNRQFMLVSQFFLSEANFLALTSDEQLQDSVNLRNFISERLALPTLRLEQLLGFEAMSAETARNLDCAPGGHCMVMELRGYTVHDRPLYLQRIQGEPFKDALMLIDTRS